MGGGGVGVGRRGRAVKGYVPSIIFIHLIIHYSDAHNSMIINPNTTHEYSNGLLSERSTHP